MCCEVHVVFYDSFLSRAAAVHLDIIESANNLFLY